MAFEHLDVSVTTNWPGSNIARVAFSNPPENGRVARRIAAEILTARGFVIEGSMGKPIRKGVYLVAVKPVTQALLETEA